jgi:predicted branched-subunit amino acid permease
MSIFLARPHATCAAAAIALRARLWDASAMSPPSASPPAAIPAAPAKSNAAAFVDGLHAAARSVFLIVIVGSYISIGALAHDLGFSMGWTVVSTLLVWAAPAQVILISALGAGTAPFEAAIAMALTGVRLLPMVVVLLPVLRAAKTRARALILPAHFTAVSFWIEALRLAPALPRENRIAFANGIGTGLLVTASIATVAGYYLAGVLPNAIVAAMLFLTPISFLTSTIRGARLLSDRAACVIGMTMAPPLAWAHVNLDLLWTGVVGGTMAYGLYRLRRARRPKGTS